MLPMAAFLWKILTTSITLGAGGSGGIITPIFFIGTATGNLFAHLFGKLNSAAYSAIGMVALLAGAANTPIAASVMAIEMFGGNIAPYAALACVVSFLMVGHRSVYPSQVLAIQKSATLSVSKGKPVGDADSLIKVTPRSKTVIGTMKRLRESRQKKSEEDGHD
jgi:chloride channel protein, CIC family